MAMIGQEVANIARDIVAKSGARDAQHSDDRGGGVIAQVARADDRRNLLARLARAIARTDPDKIALRDERGIIIGEIARIRGEMVHDAQKYMASHTIKAPADVCVEIERLVASDVAKIGPIYSRLARQYAPVMLADDRARMTRAVAITRADRLLGVTHYAISGERSICDQVLTMGSLVPLTYPFSRDVLFGIFHLTYDLKRSIEDNFARLAATTERRVIFASKVAKRAIEYDDRPIYDTEFVRKHGLLPGVWSGLNGASIRRYATIRQLSESKARVPLYAVYGRDSSSSLIIEAVTGNLFRIIGLRIPRTRSVQGGRNASSGRAARSDGIERAASSVGNRVASTSPDPEATSDRGSEGHVASAMYFTHNDECEFLVSGQSSRAEAYNARIENSIFVRALSDDVLSQVAEYHARAVRGSDMIASALRAQIRARLGAAALDGSLGANQGSDVTPNLDRYILEIAASELIVALGAQSRDIDDASMYYPQIVRISTYLARAILPHLDMSPSPSSSSKLRSLLQDAINGIIDDTSANDVFAINESVGSMYVAHIHTQGRA
jgi:hypothetical protein